uniref:Peptidase S54 rhomboid domain-containing protein n=1 Tax=Leersia perrieri TaxID=77586 RepID=A0A0D9XEF2_9ORYZ
MASSWLLLPSFPWPPPPPPGSSSGRRGGGGSGGDSGDWKPNVVAAFAGAQLGRALRRRLAGLLRSPEVRHLGALPRIGDIWFEEPNSFSTHLILGAFENVLFGPYACSSVLFNGNGSGGRYIGKGKLPSRRPSGINSKKRLWTNILLAVNILAYIAQISTQGKLLIWGAKINSMIDRGEFWRLATSSLLHANLAHLAWKCLLVLEDLLPCISLRHWQVGSYAVYTWRHRRFLGHGMESLEHIGRFVILNMGMGLLTRGIDNWGHLGGLLGGMAMAWFLGPAWQYQYVSRDGRAVFKDNAPILQLINGKRLSLLNQGVTRAWLYTLYMNSYLIRLTTGSTEVSSRKICNHSDLVHLTTL